MEVLAIPKVGDVVPGYGSGYSIGGGFVLTCAHILPPDIATYDVVLRDTAGRRLPSSPAWVSRAVDLAILRLADPAALPESMVPIRALPSDTGAARVDFTMYGWPRAGDIAGGPEALRREPVQVHGEIRLAEFAGSKTGLLRLRPDERYPSLDDGSYWQGMSGAAVFCHHAVVAVQVSQPQQSLPGYLSARPLLPDALAASGMDGFSGLELLSNAGNPIDLNAICDDLSGERQRHQNTLFGAWAPEPPPQPADPLPSWWLNPRNHAVRFIHPPQFEEMLHWCTDDIAESPPVRLLYAPGGTGKTRFAIELAATLQGYGWVAGVISDEDALGSFTRHLRPATEDGMRVFAAIDYAETGIDLLRDLLTRLAALRSVLVRVLLLARSHGRWWDGFAIGASAHNMMNPEPFSLTTVDLNNAGDIFRTAYAEFRYKLLGDHGSQCPDPPELPRPRILDLHAAALAHVLDERAGETPRQVSPLESVLAHERNYWRLALLQEGMKPYPRHRRLLDRLLATPTLHPARTFDDARDAVKKVIGPQSLASSADDLTRLLAVLYPADDGKHYWQAIVPDRLGEALVAHTIISADTTDNAAREFIELFKNASEETAIHALTVLSRVAGFSDRASSAAESSVPAVTEIIRQLLEQAPAPFLPAAVVVAESIGRPSELSELAADATRPVELHVLDRTAKHLPPFHTGLLDLAVRVERERAARLERYVDETEGGIAGADRVRLAIVLNNLALRLAAVGRHTEAYAQAGRSLRISADAAGVPDVQLLAAKAAALDTQARLSAATGIHDQAVQTAEQAVAIYRALSAEDPATWVPHLVTTLHNLGVQQASSGLRRDALAAIEEATLLYCQLSASSSVWKGELISALNSLGDLLAQLGLSAEALTISVEAERLARVSAEESPAVWLPDHANALNWLSIRLAALERYDQAAAASSESVELYRRLVDVNPAVWRGELATALNNLALRQSDLNQHILALQSAREAVDIRRTLLAHSDTAAELWLIQSLGNLANCLAALQRHEDALVVVDEAIALCRRRRHPRYDAGAVDLAMLLANQSVYLAALHRQREATSVVMDALHTYRAATRGRGEWSPELTVLLRIAGHRQRERGFLEESKALLDRSERLEAGYVDE
ncbi:tetratricopeptide repeat protein [Micromonospora sonchi]|uniref:tetratricopeptide repeat protein n=1 Tax=Micromonospora sonchi TaxID=1763543 RepID=UPI00166464B1|nr:tetratricopeptide repeat protein [Micromonospora sonchi]